MVQARPKHGLLRVASAAGGRGGGVPASSQECAPRRGGAHCMGGGGAATPRPRRADGAHDAHSRGFPRPHADPQLKVGVGRVPLWGPLWGPL